MMKKLILLVSLLIMCITLLLTACDDGNDTHEHAFSEWETITKSSCVDGIEKRTCECGETETQTIPANGQHLYTVKEMTDTYLKRAATCTGTAIYYYKCEYCDAKGTETYSNEIKGDHSFTLKTDFFVCSEANCESPKLYYYQCEYCAATGSETYPVGEEYHKFNQKLPTAAYFKAPANCQRGTEYYYKCELCDKHGDEAYTSGPITEHTLDATNICTTCDNHFIYFGEYPQTLKADGVTILQETDNRGYYLGSDGSYYAKVIASPSTDDYTGDFTFSTGAVIEDGTAYYFKVEPIRWRILTQSGGNAMILCDSAIDNTPYDTDYDNSNWKNSDLRAWLNDQFLQTAFTAIEQELINETLVDNSAETTEHNPNSFVCEDTLDKIFLLSFKEATNADYGFNVATRQLQASDFARASGTYMSTEEATYGNCDCWYLRSPDSQTALRVMMGDRNGYFAYGYTDGEACGVVPAMWITLPSN